MQNPSLLFLQSECHNQSFRMGWWADCPQDRTSPQFKWYIVTKLCLIHSEIDEASNGGNDDHLPHRSTFEVELADTVIRACDLLGFLLPIFAVDNIVCPHPKVHVAYGAPEEVILMQLHKGTSDAMEHFRKGREIATIDSLYMVVATIEAAQHEFQMDVYTAILEKLAYNAKRADHQLSNRQAAGGKSF